MKTRVCSVRRLLAVFVFLAGISAVVVAQTGPVIVDATIGTAKMTSTTPPKVRPARPETYGTSVVSYYVIDASEIDPLATANQYSAVNNGQLRFLTNVVGLGLMAPLHLPAGALLTYLELDFYDSSATGEVQATFASCNYTGETCSYLGGDPVCEDAPTTLCSGNANNFGYGSTSTDMSGNGITIDNFLKRYFLFAGNTTNDGSTAISQIIVGYVLQVSPAPGSATFPDVPTTDFGFQFVEALYASGITGGCGGGLYCPDSPVTRRQMAIFIAKALGLQWN